MSMRHDHGPVVSIVIPVYNVEPYLRPCLDSVVNQTMTEIQVICINDGSTDGSSAILEEYAGRDQRILVINKKNEGQGIARNTALERVRGKYVLFVDADDWVEPKLCESLQDRADAEQADIVFCLREKNGHVDGTKFFHKLQFNDPCKKERAFLIEHINNGPVAKLYRTDFLRSTNIRFTHHRRSQDIPVHWSSCLRGRRYVIYPEVLYHVRTVHSKPGQGKWTHVQDALGAFQHIRSDLEELGLYTQYQDVFLKEFLKSMRFTHDKIPYDKKASFMQDLAETLEPGDVERLRSGNIVPGYQKMFARQLLAIAGDERISPLFLAGKAINRRFRNFIVKPAEKIVQTLRGNPSKIAKLENTLHRQQKLITQLNELTCSLSKTIVDSERP